MTTQRARARAARHERSSQARPGAAAQAPGSKVRLAAALLLNATYEPLRVVEWRRALVLALLGRVEVLEHHDAVARTVTREIPLPAVIRLPTRAPDRARYLPFSRANLYARDRSMCQYCGARFAHPELSYDHVVPRTRGGRTEWTNVVTCCLGCNRRKGNRTPDEAGMPLTRPPVRPTSLLMTLELPADRIPGTWRPYLTGFGGDALPTTGTLPAS